jgi:hypothetical protein
MPIEAFKNGAYKRLFVDGRRIRSKPGTTKAPRREGTSMLL